jgi:hypothetical protein
LKNSFNKRKKNQKNEGQTEKNKITENLIERWNWNKEKLQQKCQGKIRNFKNWGLKWKIKYMRNYKWKTKLKRIKTINGKGTK